MAKVYFLIGGNLGDREEILKQTVERMIAEIGNLSQVSSIYETEPWGFEHELSFLNQVVVLESNLLPDEVLNRAQEIEQDLGRVRKKNRYSERTIDIDILFYDDQIISSDRLEIPHPRMQERLFALIPLKELAAGLVHPVLKKSIADLYTECQDSLEVKKYQQ